VVGLGIVNRSWAVNRGLYIGRSTGSLTLVELSGIGADMGFAFGKKKVGSFVFSKCGEFCLFGK